MCKIKMKGNTNNPEHQYQSSRERVCLFLEWFVQQQNQCVYTMKSFLYELSVVDWFFVQRDKQKKVDA